MTRLTVEQIELGLPDTPVIVPVAHDTYQIDPDANIAVADNLAYLHDIADGSMKLVVTSPPICI